MTIREKIDLKISRISEIEDKLVKLEENKALLILERISLEKDLRELSVSLKSQLSIAILVDTKSYIVVRKL